MQAKRNSTILAALMTAIVVAALATAGSAQAGPREIIVNGHRLDASQIALADRQARVRLPDGRYWYDRDSGYWGVEGGPAVGRVVANDGSSGWVAAAGTENLTKER